MMRVMKIVMMIMRTKERRREGEKEKRGKGRREEGGSYGLFVWGIQLDSGEFRSTKNEYEGEKQIRLTGILKMNY